MTDQEKKWEEEFKEWLVNSPLDVWDGLRQAYLQACKVRQEENTELKNKLKECGLAKTHGGVCPYFEEEK